MNNISLPRLGGPFLSSTWKSLLSLYSGWNSHVLPRPYAPSVLSYDAGNGPLTLSSCIYKVTYCHADPESGEILAESEPSPESRLVDVVKGRTAIQLPKRTDNLINAYRIYRLTSFRKALVKSTSLRVSSSTDDASNSTYNVPNQVIVLSPANDLEHTKSTGTAKDFRTILRTGQTSHFFGAVAILEENYIRLTYRYKLDPLLANVSVTDIKLQFTVWTSPSPTNLVDITAFNNDPLFDPLSLSIPGQDTVTPFGSAGSSTNITVWNMTNNATGSRRYVEDSTSFRTRGIKEVSLGSSSASQACLDMTAAKSQGKTFTISLKENSENTFSDSNLLTSIKDTSLKVTFNSPALGFSTNHNKLLFGNLSSSGIIFRGSTIPNAAKIKSARIGFYAFPDSINDVIGARLLIKGETPAASDVATFTDSANYSARTKTTANVGWNIDDAWKSGTLYYSPDISSILQEIVNDSDYATGDSVAFYLEDNGSAVGAIKAAYSYDADSSLAPILEVEYNDTVSIGTQYRLVDTVLGHGNRLYIDEIEDNILNNNPEIPQASSTDIPMSDFQSIYNPIGSLSADKFRINLNEKSNFKIPNDKIYMITHIAAGSAYPFTLGSDSPTTFKIWRCEGPNGYMLCNLPIPLVSGSNIKILEGRGDVSLIGYILDTASVTSVDAFWITVDNATTFTMTTKSVILGWYSDSSSGRIHLRQSNSSLTNQVGEITYYTNRYSNPNSKISDGFLTTSSLLMPIIAGEGSVLNTSGPTAYIYGLEVNSI